MKELPVFNATRCKRCGICEHFCSAQAIELHEDGMPYLAKPEACTSCALCRDMCPDWAVLMIETDMAEFETGEIADGETVDSEATDSEDAGATEIEEVEQPA